MPEIYFEVRGEPKGKGRPRFTRSGHCFTPKTTRDYERKVALAAKQAMRNLDVTDRPCEVRIMAHGGIYKSWSMKRKGQCYGEPWTGKPDADNVAKIVMDSANGLIWKDDSQIWSIQVIKLWDDDHRIEVTVEWDD